MINICIADDHPMVLDGITYMLRDHPSIRLTASYANGQSLLAGLSQSVPDVLLLDVQMPDYTAEELIPMIKAQYPEVRILCLTSVDNIHRVKILIRTGSLGYLLKNTGSEELINAIETVHRNEPYITPSIREQMDADNLRLKKEAPAGGISLTHREMEILQLIIKEYSSAEIAEQLQITIHTVEKHRSHLFLKMDVKNAVGLARKAIQMGLFEG